jgi:hypothetical protein
MEKESHSGMDKRALIEELQKSHNNIRFERFCKIVEAFNFILKGGKGSHRVYSHKGVVEILNLQEVKGKAKPYQVKQFIKIVEKYHLLEEE